MNKKQLVKLLETIKDDNIEIFVKGYDEYESSIDGISFECDEEGIMKKVILITD